MHKPIQIVPTPAVTLIAICGKCGKKLGGGFGPDGDAPLGKALRTALNLPKPKRARVRIAETKCLKLCPKGAVAVINGNDPGHILVIPEGTPVATILYQLDLPLHDSAIVPVHDSAIVPPHDSAILPAHDSAAGPE